MTDQLSSPRVLVVEDMWIVAEDIATELEDQGCQVVGPAGKLQQGLQIAQQEQLDGAFLDVNLGPENSFPIATALKARGVPFAFLTGYDLNEAFPPELADIPRLHKPVHPDDLANALAAF